MEKEPYFGFPSEKSRKDIIAGIKEAIEATKRRITEHKDNNWDFSQLELHLKSLECRLEAAQKKT